jgi:hypothetical protein
MGGGDTAYQMDEFFGDAWYITLWFASLFHFRYQISNSKGNIHLYVSVVMTLL